MEIEQHKLAVLANENINNCKGIALSKNIELAVDIDRELPPTVATDKQRLNQVIKNLMSNALKFTDDGGKVELKFEYSDAPAAVEIERINASQKAVMHFSYR